MTAVGFVEPGPDPYYATVDGDGGPAFVDIFDAASLVPIFPPLSGLDGDVVDVRAVSADGPWSDIAFPSVRWALTHYREALDSGSFHTRSNPPGEFGDY